MSFILDALKKSEADRLQRDAPGFAGVPDKAQQKSPSHWIWIVIVLIVINVVALTMMFMNTDGAPDSATARPPAESITIAPPVTTPADRVPARVAEVATRRPADTQPAPELPASPAPRVRNPANGVAQSSPRAASGAGDGSFEVIESFATFNDLRVQGILRLGDLHLDIHVFSEQPENRFVFVNMSKYKEGATLEEGPVVVEITPEGVILQHRGITFLLPRE